jgi:hypothetical protein
MQVRWQDSEGDDCGIHILPWFSTGTNSSRHFRRSEGARDHAQAALKKTACGCCGFFRFRPEPDYRTLDKAHQRVSAESVSLSKKSDCRGSPKQSPKMGLASIYSAATLWTFFSAPRPSTGRSRALVNVRTTSSSTRPRISISWRAAAPRSTPARSATASEITSSQA